MDISFNSVTVDGVQESRDAQRVDDMRQRANDSSEYSKLRQSLTKSPTRTRFKETLDSLGGVEGALKAMKEAEYGAEEPVDVVQKRASLIRKIRQYYTLEKHKNHPQIKKLEKCTLQELQTEEALLLKGSNFTLDLAFGGYVWALGEIENGTRVWNPMKWNLTGLAQVAAANKAALEDNVKEVLIYYSDKIPDAGPLSQLIGNTIALAYAVHKKNTEVGMPVPGQRQSPPPSPDAPVSTEPPKPHSILKNADATLKTTPSMEALELARASATVPTEKTPGKPGRKPKVTTTTN